MFSHRENEVDRNNFIILQAHLEVLMEHLLSLCQHLVIIQLTLKIVHRISMPRS